MTFDAPTFQISQGWFSFDKPTITRPGNKSWGKAMIDPAGDLMVYVRQGEAVIQRMPRTPANNVSNGHSPVEIYVDHGKQLLEMECHGPSQTLSPGQTMSMHLTWQYRTVPQTQDRSLMSQALRDWLNTLAR